MAEFKPKKVTANDFNNGIKYRDYDETLNYTGDTPRAEDFNNVIESQLFTQALAVNQPDVSEANNVGTASVSIVTKADGSPQLKFSNLKGKDGINGTNGTNGTNGKDGKTLYLHKQKISFPFESNTLELNVPIITSTATPYVYTDLYDILNAIGKNQFAMRIYDGLEDLYYGVTAYRFRTSSGRIDTVDIGFYDVMNNTNKEFSLGEGVISALSYTDEVTEL